MILSEFLDKLANVIFDYHHKKNSSHSLQTKFANLINKPLQEIRIELETMILASTEGTTSTRLPLLRYIEHVVESLKLFMDHPENIQTNIDHPENMSSDIEHPENIQTDQIIKMELIEFIINIQNLLTTSQSQEAAIQYNNQTVKMYGLYNGLVSHSVAGDLLHKEILEPLNLSTRSDVDKIKQTVVILVQNYQLAVQHIEICRLKEGMKDLYGELDILQAQLETTSKYQEELQVQQSETQHLTERLAAEITEKERYQNEFAQISDKNHQLLQQISELGTTIEQLQQELQASQVDSGSPTETSSTSNELSPQSVVYYQPRYHTPRLYGNRLIPSFFHGSLKANNKVIGYTPNVPIIIASRESK